MLGLFECAQFARQNANGANLAQQEFRSFWTYSNGRKLLRNDLLELLQNNAASYMLGTGHIRARRALTPNWSWPLLTDYSALTMETLLSLKTGRLWATKPQEMKQTLPSLMDFTSELWCIGTAFTLISEAKLRPIHFKIAITESSSM